MSTTSKKISQALGPREVIAGAVRILMASHGVGEEAALDLLVRSASESRVGVRETARRIVASSRQP
jgi:AmiR/NasT family two-component response regulator